MIHEWPSRHEVDRWRPPHVGAVNRFINASAAVVSPVHFTGQLAGKAREDLNGADAQDRFASCLPSKVAEPGSDRILVEQADPHAVRDSAVRARMLRGSLPLMEGS